MSCIKDSKIQGGRVVREFGINMDTLLYLKWIANKDLLYGTGNSAQCCVAAWMGGVFGEDWIRVTCICMAESLRCSPETITALLTGYNPVQNEKLKEKLYIRVYLSANLQSYLHMCLQIYI